MSSSSHSISDESESESLLQFIFDDTTEKEIQSLLENNKSFLALLELLLVEPESEERVNRDREAAHRRLYADYFSENSIYESETFPLHFCMSKELFLRIVDGLESHDDYFRWRVDAVGKKGFSPIQKCTVAIRQLAYGGFADHWNKYLCVAETTAIECLFKFCRCVIELIGEYYLRKPTAQDCQRLLQMHEERHGFPRILGSLDCMHWEWRNCPVAWKGQFTRGDHDVPTIMLEAVASTDLWI